MTSAFGGQRSIQLSYGCSEAAVSSAPTAAPACFWLRRLAKSQRAAAYRWCMTPDPPRPLVPEAAAGAIARAEQQWQALLRAEAAVAIIAGAATRQPGAAPAVFSGEDYRAVAARRALADVAAVIEPGLEALVAVHRRGGDPQPAARALLRELATARDALSRLPAAGVIRTCRPPGYPPETTELHGFSDLCPDRAG